jgi:peptidoglycan hydrolase-like protein with peptidoglycan-binding domain
VPSLIPAATLLALAVCGVALMRTEVPDRGPVPPSAAGAEPAAAAGPLILAIQKHLAVAGLDPGPIDGIPGRRTADAIRAFQSAIGLPDDGVPSVCLLRALMRRTRACP